MMAPRLRKTVSDITTRPGRSALAVLAMVVGIAVLGTLAFSYSLMRPVLASMYGGTQPAAAVFYTDAVNDDLVEAVKGLPEVGEAEARPVIMARLNPIGSNEDEWIPAFLYVVRDFEEQKINLCLADRGAWPPDRDEVLLERAAERMAGGSMGDQLRLRVPGSGERSLRFAGTTYAAGLAPAWMEHLVWGFIPWDSDLRDGTQRESSQLLIRVAEHELEIGHIREVADLVKATIESHGYQVRRVEIPTPGGHPHAGQMSAFLYLVGSFAALAFLLSAVLVASMIHTLQSEQVQQVGMMKAIGATSSQIAGVYLSQVGLLVATALLIAVPIAWFAGRTYAKFSAGILNADVTNSPFPIGTLLMIVAVSVLVPMLTALVPVLRASRITVREALSHSSGARPFGSGRFETWLTRIPWITRPLALILRTTLQRRARLALTVGMLAIGGTIFMAAINLSLGWNSAVDKDFDRRQQDVTVVFAEAQPIAEVDQALQTLPAVAHAEYWPAWRPYLIDSMGVATKEVVMVGVPPGSRLYNPEMVSGTWLDAASPDGVVVNNGVISVLPTLEVGDTITLRRDGTELRYPIVGVIKELTPSTFIYTTRDNVLKAAGLNGETARSVHVVTREQGEVSQLDAATALERLFEDRQVEIQRLSRLDDVKAVMLDHLVIIQAILLMAAAIVVIVGGIGLASTLTVNVLQRAREIGIMSAIGARPRTLASHVWCDGLVTILLSWLVAVALAAPISYLLGVVTGNLFLKTPLAITPSWQAMAVWFVLAIALGSISSFVPALRAAQQSVRKAIDHIY
jgi:putative ABC transport system permease protein